MKLFIIADDFTGALDSGVQFGKHGVSTCVVSDIELLRRGKVFYEYQVIVFNSATRHVSADEAYRTVYEAASLARSSGAPVIYKKTDSALRGNIGSELKAVLDASGETILPFLPAYPQMKRTVKNGKLFIDGVPVSESVFASDPLDPVTTADIAELIHRQELVRVVNGKETFATEDPSILVVDAETDDELTAAADRLGSNALRICAGCAGFAAVLANRLALEPDTGIIAHPQQRLMVFSGSVNPISVEQIREAEKNNCRRFKLSTERKLDHEWLQEQDNAFADELLRALDETGICIVDGGGEATSDTFEYADRHNICRENVCRRIADSFGILLKLLLDRGMEATIMCIGGDTLQALMEQLQVRRICPIAELLPGVVLTAFPYRGKLYYLITKSGGFGDPQLINHVRTKLTEGWEQNGI